MAEVVLEFENAVTDRAGRSYTARVCGRAAPDGLWDGWLEFLPRDSGTRLRTPRETRQPKHSDLQYWATGLTAAYLEGALERALAAAPARERAERQADSGERADAGGGASVPRAPGARRPRPLLDPFALHAQGEEVLRRRLGVLGEAHLRNIISAYALVDAATVDLGALGRAALVDLVIAAVRRRVLGA